MEEKAAGKASHRSLWLELFKIFLFLGVVIIHSAYKMEPKYLARISVPAFFMISGAFCYCKKREEESEEEYQARKLGRAKKKVISMLFYLIFGFVAYYIFDVVYAFATGGSAVNAFNGFYSDHLFVDIFFYNHVSHSGGHLWFVLALFAVSCLHYLLVRFKAEKAYFFLPLLIVVLYVFKVLTFKFGQGAASSEKIRNSLFFALPCFATGFSLHYLLSRIPFQHIWAKILFLILSFALGAACFYLQLEEQKWLGFDAEIYIASFCSALCFLSFFLLCPSPSTRPYEFCFGTHLPFFAYVYHWGVLQVLSYLGYSGPTKTYSAFGIALALAFLTHWILFFLKLLLKAIEKKRGGRKFDWSLS